METFSKLLTLCAGNSTVTGEFPSQSQWRGAFVFSLIWAWTNGWANNRDASYLRCHRAHYDVTVMNSQDFVCAGPPPQHVQRQYSAVPIYGGNFVIVLSHARHGISNNQKLNCLFNSLLRLTSQKTSKLSTNDPLWGESTTTYWWIPFIKGL